MANWSTATSSDEVRMRTAPPSHASFSSDGTQSPFRPNSETRRPRFVVAGASGDVLTQNDSGCMATYDYGSDMGGFAGPSFVRVSVACLISSVGVQIPG